MEPHSETPSGVPVFSLRTSPACGSIQQAGWPHARPGRWIQYYSGRTGGGGGPSAVPQSRDKDRVVRLPTRFEMRALGIDDLCEHLVALGGRGAREVQVRIDDRKECPAVVSPHLNGEPSLQGGEDMRGSGRFTWITPINRQGKVPPTPNGRRQILVDGIRFREESFLPLRTRRADIFVEVQHSSGLQAGGDRAEAAR